jgi:predicted amidohydrolase YtcJ
MGEGLMSIEHGYRIEGNSMHADIIIKNGKCMTMENGQVFDWIATSKELIIALGRGNDYAALVHNNTIVIDAKEATVLPGFIDSHFHVVQTALNSISLDLSHARTHEDVGELVREAAKMNPGKQIRGIRLEMEKLKEKEMPTRTFLDKCCNDVPVWINSLEYQVSVLNTYALLYFKIPFTTEGVEVDDKEMPTGVFKKKANAILRSNILKNIADSRRMEAVAGIMEELISNGITTVNAMEGGALYSDKDADFIHKHGKEFPVDMELFYQTMDLNKIKSMNLKRVGGSLYLDGTLGARTAALSFEYEDCPGTMGSLCLPQQEIDDFVLKCYKNNLQLALYTIGDRAIEAALKAHEYAFFQTGNIGLRHRLEHVELANHNQVKRARDMGLVFSMQPTYEYYWGGAGKMYEQRIGNKYERTNRFREILDSGICVCGGSDSDVTEPKPMLGVHAAVNHPVEAHRVTVEEALKMFTCNGAYAIFAEDKKGSLSIGKIADIVILDRDVLMTPSKELKNVNVSTTIKSGEILYNLMGDALL